MSALPDAIFDPQRLRAVQRTAQLGPVAEEAFDRLTLLAIDVLGVSFAFVTLVDDTRAFWQSFRSTSNEKPSEQDNPVEESLCQYVIGSGQRLLVADAAHDELTRTNPSVSRMNVGAWAGFPIYSLDHEILGTFSVVDSARREWSERDVFVLESLALAASSEVALRDAVASAEAFQAQAESAAVRFAGLAHILQDVLVPETLPLVPGISLAARFRAAGDGMDLVGDFFDVFTRGDGTVGLVLGDVAGKGNEAAKTTVIARHGVRAAETRIADPAQILSMLNDILLSRLDSEERFVTAVYCSLVPADDGWVARLARAGHTEPILRSASGKVTQLHVKGMVLGSFETSMLGLQTLEIPFREGDTLVLYSDGVLDARQGKEFFGEDRLVAAIEGAGQSPDEIADAIMAAISFFSDEHFSDDVAVLVARAARGSA